MFAANGGDHSLLDVEIRRQPSVDLRGFPQAGISNQRDTCTAGTSSKLSTSPGLCGYVVNRRWRPRRLLHSEPGWVTAAAPAPALRRGPPAPLGPPLQLPPPSGSSSAGSTSGADQAATRCKHRSHLYHGSSSRRFCPRESPHALSPSQSLRTHASRSFRRRSPASGLSSRPEPPRHHRTPTFANDSSKCSSRTSSSERSQLTHGNLSNSPSRTRFYQNRQQWDTRQNDVHKSTSFTRSSIRQKRTIKFDLGEQNSSSFSSGRLQRSGMPQFQLKRSTSPICTSESRSSKINLRKSSPSPCSWGASPSSRRNEKVRVAPSEYPSDGQERLRKRQISFSESPTPTTFCDSSQRRRKRRQKEELASRDSTDNSSSERCHSTSRKRKPLGPFGKSVFWGAPSTRPSQTQTPPRTKRQMSALASSSGLCPSRELKRVTSSSQGVCRPPSRSSYAPVSRRGSRDAPSPATDADCPPFPRVRSAHRDVQTAFGTWPGSPVGPTTSPTCVDTSARWRGACPSGSSSSCQHPHLRRSPSCSNLFLRRSQAGCQAVFFSHVDSSVSNASSIDWGQSPAQSTAWSDDGPASSRSSVITGCVYPNPSLRSSVCVLAAGCGSSGSLNAKYSYGASCRSRLGFINCLERERRGMKLLRAAKEGKTTILRRLLNEGVDPNFTYGTHWTALHSTVRFAHADAALLLLQRGADANARDVYGFSPLHVAAARDRSGRHVALLLDAGADPNARSRSGRTPLHLAAEGGNAAGAARLVAAGACATATDDDGLLPWDLTVRACVRRLLGPPPC